MIEKLMKPKCKSEGGVGMKKHGGANLFTYIYKSATIVKADKKKCGERK